MKPLSSSASDLSLAVDSTNVYWPDDTNVDYIPTAGGLQGTQSLPSTDVASEVTTDGLDVYVAQPSGIVAFPSGGGTLTTLVSNESSPHGLSVAAGMLYWANGSDQVRRVQTDGTDTTTLATCKSPIVDLATDGKNAYYATMSEIFAVPVDR